MTTDRTLFPTLVRLLSERGATLSAAESCTGGWFAKSIVDVPGASAVFFGGVVSYVDAVKAGVLGVRQESLARYGAVSAPVAAEMAEGVRRLLGTSLAVSVTGFAGGGSDPDRTRVGQVFIAISRSAGTHVHALSLTGGRQQIRLAAVRRMAEELVKCLSEGGDLI